MKRLLIGLLAGFLSLALPAASPAAAQTTATCDTLPAAIAAAPAGSTVYLAPGSDCGPAKSIYRNVIRISPAITVAAKADRVTVDVTGSSIKGLNLPGAAGLTFIGGKFAAAEGYGGNALNGYAIALTEVADIAFEGADISDASKGVAMTRSTNVRFTNSRWHGKLGDGIIGTATNGFILEWSRMADWEPAKPQECLLPDGKILYGIGLSPCNAFKGSWTDGYHQDGAQLYKGMTNVIIRFNVIDGVNQGVDDFSGLNRKDGQVRTPAMNPANDNWRIYGNLVLTTGYHSISLNDCTRCLVWGNKVGNLTPGRKSPIRPGNNDNAPIACENDDPFDAGNRAACPAGMAR